MRFKNRFFASSRVSDAWDQYHAEKDGYDHVARTLQPPPPMDYDELQRQLGAAEMPGWERLNIEVHPDVVADLDLMQRRLNLNRSEIIQKALELLKVLSTRRSYTAIDEAKIHEII